MEGTLIKICSLQYFGDKKSFQWGDVISNEFEQENGCKNHYIQV
jgi:hypothetical protein